MADPTREEAEFDDDDDAGGGESTVAMQSPSFDPSMPSPVSVPPPPPGPGLAMPTSPLAFPPPGADPRYAGGATAQSPAVPPGASPRAKRAQTVIGIAPPGQGAQRPPTPMNPTAPVAAPPPPQRPASVPRIPARPPVLGGDELGPETAAVFDTLEKEPPTRAVKVDAATFALDEAAGAAARAATRPGPARHSPLASTGFAPNGPGPLGAKAPAAAPKPLPRPPTMDQENTTTAFVDDLNLVLAGKSSGGLPKLHENEGEDESTRAVPREELLRQDAQLVVGADAAGEDATLAVPPGMNEALSARFPIGADGSGGHPAIGAPSPGFHASASPTQQSPQFAPMLGPQSGGAWGMQGSQTSQMPSSTSAMPMLPPYQQPGAFPPVQGGPMPMPYPQQDWQQPQQGWQQPGWQQPQHIPGAQMAPSPPKKFPLSTQVIVLGLIGIVCLAIFVTGVVLFFTTKF